MPQKKKVALSGKRTTLAKKKTKGKTRKPRSTAKAKAVTPRKRKTASAKKKVNPGASTKQASKSKARRQSPASKAKSSTSTRVHPQRMQPRRRNARPQSGLRGPRKAPSAKGGSVEVVEHLVVDTVEEVAPGVLVVKEYEIEGEAVVTPPKGGSETV
jgi:hypothetical protein